MHDAARRRVYNNYSISLLSCVYNNYSIFLLSVFPLLFALHLYILMLVIFCLHFLPRAKLCHRKSACV